MKRISDFLGGIPMTIIGGVFLIFSFLYPTLNLALPFDPAWVSVIICGIPMLYLSVWRLIYNPGISKISSALLITIAMIAAILIHDLFAAGEVAFIMAIGAILEEKTTERAKKGLKKLISLSPRQARKLVDGKENLVPADEINPKDIIRVLPGETIPVDGIVTEGNTSVDQSVMTGESIPIDKEPNDSVYSGTINCFGTVDIEVTKAGEDSSLQKLIQMVQEAENQKAPMARIADKAASWLVPVALLLAVSAYLFTGNIVRGVTVLVVFCPCALVLATPTAVMAAIGQAAKQGIIIKSGEALEKMGKTDNITFDKTGTLTSGKLKVTDIITFTPEFDEDTLLSLIASVESKSEHPLGKAISAYAKGRNILIREVSTFYMDAGKGVRGNLNNLDILCGNQKYLQINDVKITEQAEKTLQLLSEQGKATILASVNGFCAGIIALSDTLRPDAKKVVEQLNLIQTTVFLLTGDSRRTADYFAQQAGITTVYADLLPKEKVDIIENLQNKSGPVCMIGDGVNDAPALKSASVGIAMGSMGSDIAIEAADIALMSDDISKIPYLKRLSNATVRTIKFSIGLSLFINFIAIALSFNGFLTPTTGALVHNAGSVLVVLIAALLYDRKFD
jgi:Cu+-exporting ATPase